MPWNAHSHRFERVFAHLFSEVWLSLHSVVGARGLQEKYGKPSAHALLTVGATVVKTATVENSECPVWNCKQKIRLSDCHDPNVDILVQIWGKGKSLLRQKLFLGQCRVRLGDLLTPLENERDEEGEADATMRDFSTVKLAGVADVAFPYVAGARWFKLRRRQQSEHVSGELSLLATFVPDASQV